LIEINMAHPMRSARTPAEFGIGVFARDINRLRRQSLTKPAI
jgi:hypothetical protein